MKNTDYLLANLYWPFKVGVLGSVFWLQFFFIFLKFWWLRYVILKYKLRTRIYLFIKKSKVEINDMGKIGDILLIG